MRIIAGQHRGRLLKTPTGPETRPTMDRTREAIFSMIFSRIPIAGIRVVDLFAGSGALGLEALSRGAAQCTFVEQHAAAFKTLSENVHLLNARSQSNLVKSSVEGWLARQKPNAYALILADPPYEYPGLDTLPDALLPLLHEDGLLVLEHDDRHQFDDHPAHLLTRAYGKTHVSLFSPS